MKVSSTMKKLYIGSSV